MYTQGFDVFDSFSKSMMLVLIAIMAVSLLIGIIFYILNAIGLSKIAKKMGHPTPYFAWIPFLSTYLVGELAKDEIKRVKNITYPHTLYDNLGIIMVVVPLASLALSWIPILGSLVSFAASIFSLVLMCIALFHIYKQFVGDSSATGFVVLYVFLAPVAMLYIASKELLYPNAFTEQHNQNS